MTYASVKLTLRGGEVVEGSVKDSDDESITLGSGRRIERSAIESETITLTTDPPEADRD